MKTLIEMFGVMVAGACIAILMFMCSQALAAPFLVCDPQSGVTNYVLTGPSWVTTTVPAQPDGSIRMDVSTALVGVNSLTVKACNSWGECSIAVPFSFTRPAAPASTSNIRLIP